MFKNTVPFSELARSDLRVDATYAGGLAKNMSDDPIARLIPVGNSGGIRFQGSRTAPTLVALITSGEDQDWPDSFDPETGTLIYFGDNKREGRELHDTPRGGNVVLRNIFDAAFGGEASRSRVPPTLVFSKAGTGRSYQFLGLAVPGAPSPSISEDLVGQWRSKSGLRYQNYRARFTILAVPTVTRTWLDEIAAGSSVGDSAPSAWTAWKRGAAPRALRAPRTIEHRSRGEQEPQTAADRETVRHIYEHFSTNPHDFERFAARLIEIYLPEVATLDVTRKSRDGGRDGIGTYRIGNGAGSILLDFSVEAKCYRPGNSVGVRELSRLISRLRHRQFGILVTTSHLDLQAYKELKEDKHPIIVISGREVAAIIRNAGILGEQSVDAWLAAEFPLTGSARSIDDRVSEP